MATHEPLDTPSAVATTPDETQPERQPGVRQKIVAVRQNILVSTVFAAAALLFIWVFTEGDDAPPRSQDVTLTAKASGSAPRTGQPAPEFSVVSLDGNSIQLSELRGHPVWVNFWASWCPPCRAEGPEIEAAYREYGDQGLVIVGLNVGESASIVREYVTRVGLTFLIGGDPGTDVAAAFRVKGLPTNFFINADGIVQDIRIGRLTSETIRNEMSMLFPNSDQR
ncbi:MAG: redoxin domain-containing protein [Anaerolineaceae bacterium]